MEKFLGVRQMKQIHSPLPIDTIELERFLYQDEILQIHSAVCE